VGSPPGSPGEPRGPRSRPGERAEIHDTPARTACTAATRRRGRTAQGSQAAGGRAPRPGSAELGYPRIGRRPAARRTRSGQHETHVVEDLGLRWCRTGIRHAPSVTCILRLSVFPDRPARPDDRLDQVVPYVPSGTQILRTADVLEVLRASVRGGTVTALGRARPGTIRNHRERFRLHQDTCQYKTSFHTRTSLLKGPRHLTGRTPRSRRAPRRPWPDPIAADRTITPCRGAVTECSPAAGS